MRKRKGRKRKKTEHAEGRGLVRSMSRAKCDVESVDRGMRCVCLSRRNVCVCRVEMPRVCMWCLSSLHHVHVV